MTGIALSVTDNSVSLHQIMSAAIARETCEIGSYDGLNWVKRRATGWLKKKEKKEIERERKYYAQSDYLPSCVAVHYFARADRSRESEELACKPVGCSPGVRYRCPPLIRPSPLSCIFPADRAPSLQYIYLLPPECSTQALKRDAYIYMVYRAVYRHTRVHIRERWWPLTRNALWRATREDLFVKLKWQSAR